MAITTLAPGYTGPTLPQLNAAFHPRIPRYDKYENEQERLGVTGSLQFAPTDSTAINFDALYSKLDGTRTEQFLQAPVFSAAGAAGIGDVDVREAEIRTGRQGQTALVYGVFDDVDVRSEQRFDSLTTEFTQFTLDGSHDFGNGLKLTALAGMAESEHDNPKQTTLLFDALNVDGYVYDFRKDDRLPLISYGALDVTAPASWRLTQIRLRPQTADNSFNTFEGNLEYEFSPALTLKGGLQFKQYEFETTELRRSNGTTTNLEAVIPASVAGVPLADYSSIVNLNGLGAPSGTTLRWLVPNVQTGRQVAQPVRPKPLPDGARALARQQPGGRRGRRRRIRAARFQHRDRRTAAARQRRRPLCADGRGGNRLSLPAVRRSRSLPRTTTTTCCRR